MTGILITGNLGYIGMKMTESLLEEGYEIVGVDTGFSNDNLLYKFDFSKEFIQLKKDIRDINLGDLKNIDAIIHLAALSNDPLGEINPNLTDLINLKASVKLAELAKKAKVKRFLFSSSCSIYGATNDKMLDENAIMNPLSAYAFSKVNLEKELTKLADNDFSPIFLRNGTAYGASPNMRFDLVTNNLMGWAYTTKEIKIMSDGKAWRPIVHIGDVVNAFKAALEAPKEMIHNEAFNVGINSENFQIKVIAEEIHKVMKDCEVKILGENNPDQRNYIVNFDKINKKLYGFKPKWDLRKGIKELYEIFKKIDLSYEKFQDRHYTRLKQLKFLMENKFIDNNLNWIH